MSSTGNRKIVYAALSGNLAIAVSKFTAAFLPGSIGDAQQRRAFAGGYLQRTAPAAWHAVRDAHPDVLALFVKPQTVETWARRVARLRRPEG